MSRKSIVKLPGLYSLASLAQRKNGFPLSDSLFRDCYRTVPEDKVVAMLNLAGGAYEPVDRTIAQKARIALQRWVDLGLPYLISDREERMFDPVEVWASLKQLGQAGTDPFFRDHFVATGRCLVNDLATSATPAGPFCIEIHRTFFLSDTLAGQSLRLRLPRPLDLVHADQSVEVLGNESNRNPAVVRSNRLELNYKCLGEEPVTLGARVTFSAPFDHTVKEDRDVYLRPREGAVVVSNRVHDLAFSLAGQGSTAAQAVSAFWTFMIECFVCTPIHYDQVDQAAPCDWVLDMGVYDCRCGAALFVALCRARGIPARIIGGYVLYPRAPTNHFWAEYWCRDSGWTPIDFLGWDLSCGGHDSTWRDHFFGQLDARLVTERLPLAFTGAPGIPIPQRWHLLQTAATGGVEITVTEMSGRKIYSDAIRVIAYNNGLKL